MTNEYNIKKNILSGLVSGENKFKLEEFVAEMQGFSLGLRHEHWKTTSYAEHKAVESAQADLDGLIDDFVEACVGMQGGSRPTFVPSITASADDDKIITCLKAVGVKDTSLLNIRDEMLQVVYRLKYLRTLK